VTDHGVSLGEVVAPAARFVKLPAGWSFEQGAAFPVSYLHAFELVAVMGRARPGMRVQVHGAASALGRAALQIAGALGCELIEAAEGTAVLGVNLDYLFDDPAHLCQRFEEILALPGVCPSVGALFPVEEMREALALLQSGQNAGKVVLAVDPP